MIKLNDDTPVEVYKVKDYQVLVKREDLAAPYGGPPFSKIRGLVPYLEKLKKEGYKNIGYVETSISMAGWGVAWVCHHLKLHCVIFDPQYKGASGLLEHHRKQWKKWGAELRPIPAGMARVNWNVVHQSFNGMDDFLLPLGLPLPTTVFATAQVARQTQKQHNFNTIVVNVGSGTICAGILLGVSNSISIHGVMGRTSASSQRGLSHKIQFIYQKAGVLNKGLLGKNNLKLHDPGWEYAERSTASCPFPTHGWYDLKAFQWLKENIERLRHPVLFWNIGREE
jgi:1-aminocyclopropane-1-carboxylate deaminase/D-cysteine desulfhydrase-like pyridoxal-dependent ACC family enzyme